MEKIIEELIKNGPLGAIAAYFLWNDFQDRKLYRTEIKEFVKKITEHDIRITVLEEKKLK